ncbi:MAG: DNA adenine methylase [Myxococcales bacterium]
MPERGGLAPFLKWVGGKRSLLPQLLAFIPPKIKTYYEPFIGGGAVFFELARLGRFQRARLSDSNEELIRCYAAIKRDVTRVVSALEKHHYDEEAYYRVRELDPAKLSDPECAARTIYLNRCGFNGLYRVNQSGRFNVPFGQYKKPRLIQPERLRLVAAALQNAHLEAGDFETMVAGAGRGDFVYFDPPYVPVSPTANFTAYARLGFAGADQERLAALLRRLGKARVSALLSNSDCAETRRLYRGLPLSAVDVRRSINSDITKRGPVSELIVRSFSYPC